MIHILFRSSLGKDNCAKFYHCRICVTDFREEAFLSTKNRQQQEFKNIFFTRAFNPSHVINSNKFTRSLKNIRSNESKQCFQNKTIQLVTREPKNLLKYLSKAKFEENPLTPPLKEVGFFSL